MKAQLSTHHLSSRRTTLELLTDVSDLTNKLSAARKDQDWVEAQHLALQLARVFRQLQVEEKSGQQFSEAATPASFRAWLAQVRKTIA